MKDSSLTNRPSLLDLRSHSANSAASSSSRPLRSPRLHVAGEAPPELSPLDAFALQSRLLARQLQETTNKDGNRVSRLPPLTAESPLIIQGRSEYFRSMSQDSGSERDESPAPPLTPGFGGLGLRTEMEDAFSDEVQRPRSMHPRMSRIPPTPDEGVPPLPEDMPDVPDIPEYARGRQLGHQNDNTNFFGARQDRSPSPLQSDTLSQLDRQSTKSPTPSHPQFNSFPSLSNMSPRRTKQSSFDEVGLAPPRSLLAGRSLSALSSPVPPDEETFGNMSSSVQSLPSRKLSSGSAALPPHMASSVLPPFQRSPSVASESSALPRPAFNFSRPMSRAGTPNLDHPIRQASSDSQPSFILADESAHTPISMHSEAFAEQPSDDKAGGSYVYSKFVLPRGKSIQRSESSDLPPQAGAPPSPPTRPSSSSARAIPDDAASISSAMSRQRSDAGKLSMESSQFAPYGRASPNPSRPSTESRRHAEDSSRGRSRTLHTGEAPRGRTPASVGTSDSAQTIRPTMSVRSTTSTTTPTAAEMTAEEHLAKGIECHENGSLNESTYHLRHAARLNHPTAMLLYALACRHGWGMKPNQKEGVQWLRKAADMASGEVAEDEGNAKEGKRINIAENKTHKAQFALSIYELGVSHMNGWGIEQDKALALRCFEIAGTWGDVDALAEAGFCYAQGIGCKKNLKKSAKFYRMAEAKGMSMVGNSWIHKAKYMDDEDAPPKPPAEDKKSRARSKSRSRAMFGKK
ncbi:Protein DSF2 [Trichoderma lentiforme]|uniref:Protein DSF2 n=1 Tax=Trichoderma lentiforme TaxID=1567552 RepID=A0A9P5CGS5_9HYPO|nr:Protein DSF2 [Trichoderma lentiforme]